MAKSSNCQGDCVFLDKQPKIFVNLILSIALSFHLALDKAHVLVHVLVFNERCMHNVQPSSQQHLLHVLSCIRIHLMSLGEGSLPSFHFGWKEVPGSTREGSYFCQGSRLVHCSQQGVGIEHRVGSPPGRSKFTRRHASSPTAAVARRTRSHIGPPDRTRKGGQEILGRSSTNRVRHSGRKRACQSSGLASGWAGNRLRGPEKETSYERSEP